MSLVRLSQIDEVPLNTRLFSKHTFYRWHRTHKYPQIFVKVSGKVFVDLKAFDDVIASCRAK